ncbi:MAG: DUF934 domain-containing protein [Proteobacteria bacterium]|nr:DUF934 domain-containing protein [Pseudomonadota bacterium]
MPLIKDNELVPDPWVTLGDDEALPEGAPAIVSFERWQSEREALLQRNAPLGIRLRSDQPPKLVLDDLDRFAVVALEFPKFGDGRAYSYARLLRERYGYRGELRAVGNVLRDQALFMLRCGFDAFELAEDSALEGWRESLAEISVFYQPTADGRSTAHALRRNGNGAIAPRAEESDDDGPIAAASAAPAAAETPGLSAAPEPITAHRAY